MTPAQVAAWVAATAPLRALLDEQEPESCIRCGEPFDPASSRDPITCPDCRIADGLLP